jgi:TIR domain
MPYTPGVLHDVFVSYPRRANRNGWVTQFKDGLEDRLKTALGGQNKREPDVWMDARLEPGADFRNEIQEKLRKSAIFIAVVSPSYVQSSECMDLELGFFLENTPRGKVIQILQIPLEDRYQRMPLPELQYTKFFETEDLGAKEFKPSGSKFSKAMDKFAFEVRKDLIDMRRKLQQIYLTQLDSRAADADNAATLSRHRDTLLNEFEDRGYGTLPRQVERQADDFTRQMVEDSDVLVYLASANGTLEAAEFQLALELRKPTVVCSLRPLPSLNASDDLPVILGATDWKHEVVRRVESKLSARTPWAAG